VARIRNQAKRPFFSPTVTLCWQPKSSCFRKKESSLSRRSISGVKLVTAPVASLDSEVRSECLQAYFWESHNGRVILSTSLCSQNSTPKLQIESPETRFDRVLLVHINSVGFLGDSPLAQDLFGALVGSKPQVDGMAHFTRVRPLSEFHLCDENRLYPCSNSFAPHFFWKW
jgi:hypothetical protein